MTLALVVSRRRSLLHGIHYIIAQLAGATTGAAISYAGKKSFSPAVLFVSETRFAFSVVEDPRRRLRRYPILQIHNGRVDNIVNKPSLLIRGRVGRLAIVVKVVEETGEEFKYYLRVWSVWLW